MPLDNLGKSLSSYASSNSFPDGNYLDGTYATTWRYLKNGFYMMNPTRCRLLKFSPPYEYGMLFVSKYEFGINLMYVVDGASHVYLANHFNFNNNPNLLLENLKWYKINATLDSNA